MADDLVIPAEFQAEALGIPPTEPPPEALITRFNPTGKRLDSDASFGTSFRGALRSNTILGALSEAGDNSVARNGRPELQDDERTRLQRTIDTGTPYEADVAKKALARKEKAGPNPARQQEAEDAIAEQIAYDESGSFNSAAGVAGTILGSIASPENIGGFSGLLVRKFPMLAGRPIATTAIDAAITNTLTDPVVQGIRTASGGQESYNVGQTLLAPVVGAAAGGALAGAGQAVSRGITRAAGEGLTAAERAANEMAARRAFDPANAQRTIDDVVNAPEPKAPTQAGDPPLPGPLSEDLPTQFYGDTLSAPASGRLAEVPELPAPSISARITAPSIRAELGADIPGTLIRELRGMPEANGEMGGIVAFHGSPHDFDRFSLDKIGSGEGNQAYGRGLYFAENERVAKDYHEKLNDLHNHGEEIFINGKRLDDNNPSHLASGYLFDEGGDAARAKQRLQNFIEGDDDPKRIAIYKEAQALLDSGKPLPPASTYGGALYEVRISAHPERFLDWDKPVSEQSPFVREALAKLNIGETGALDVPAGKFASKPLTGADAYKWAGIKGDTHIDALSHKRLTESGIDGIRYLDGASRGKGEGSSNFVVFDDSKIRIVAKNGEKLPQPIPVADYLKGEAKAGFAEELKAAKVSPKDIPASVQTRAEQLIDSGVVRERGEAIETAALEREAADPRTRESLAKVYGDEILSGPTQSVRADIGGTGEARALPEGEGGIARAAENGAGPRETGGGTRATAPGEDVAFIGQPVPALGQHRVSTPNGMSIDVRPVVVEASSLRVSSDPGYDAALQPRNRERAASQAQVRDISTRLDPERLGVSAEADRGAPIVGADSMVESGNGRVMAIREAYKQGGEAAARYRDWIAAQGVDVAGLREPVLVRQRLTDLTTEQRLAFTVEANQAATLSMSAGERAIADARMLKPETLDLIRNPDDLGALGNRDFVTAFVRGLPQSEQGMIATAQGGLSSEGLGRIRNAVLARAYGDAALLSRVAEATSDDIKSISNALVSAAPEWSKFRADVEAGRVRADVDLTPELMEAVTRTADLRAKGLKLDTFLAQQDAFDRITSPVEAFMRMFYNDTGRRAAGSPVIAERIKFYAQEARKVSNDAGLGFDLPAVRAEDIQVLAAKKGRDERAATANQKDIFESGSPRDGARDGEGGAQAVGTETGAGRGGTQDAGGSGVAQGRGQPATAEGVIPDQLLRRGNQQSPPLPNQVRDGRPTPDQGTPTVPEVRVKRLEDIGRGLVDAFETIARTGNVPAGAQGVYKTKFGVVRVKSISDFDTLAHEIGHALHIDGGARSDFDNVVRANISELSQFGAGQGREADAEAFANLFHAYVTNKAFADRNYPNATAQLDELMRTRFPDQFKAVETIRGELDALHRAPSEAVVSADMISKGPPRFGETFQKAIERDIDPQGRTVYSVMDALYTANVDSQHPILKAVRSLVETAQANGKDINLRPTDDAYILARMIPGSHAAADTMLKHGVIPAGGIRPEGPSLASGIEKALGKKFTPDQFNEFGAYLTARRMVAEYQRMFAGELERKPGKYTLGDYEQAVAAFEARNPAFREGADDIYAFQQAHLKRLFDKGMVTREFYEVSSTRKDYVPAMRDMADFAGEVGKNSSSGAGNNLAYSVAKQFRGSDRSVINPLESIFKRVHDLEFAIARNDAVSALARLAEDAGTGAGYIFEPVPNSKLTPQRVDIIEALRNAGRREGIDNADLTQLILQVEDHLGDSTWATLFRQKDITEGPDPIVFYWVNGERRAGYLGDGKLGRELFHAMTSLSDLEKNWFVSTLQVGQMMLRTGVTRSLDFILVNFIRDQFTASLTAGRRYIPFVSAAKGVVDVLRGQDNAIEYTGRGGLAGGALVASIEHSSFGKNVYALTHGGNLLEKIGRAMDLSEAGTRVGLYESHFKQAKDLGFSDEDAWVWAAFRANDYIDFRKHGASLGFLRRTIPFLNAAVQGTDKEIRAVVDLPKLEAKRARGETLTTMEIDRLSDARVGLTRLMLTGVVLGAGLAVYNQDNERWTNAHKFVRDQNFLFSIGGMDFALPKGFGVVQSTVNLFERAMELAIRKDPTIATDWLEAAGSAFAPPTQNPFFSTYMDVTANYNRFRDREIVPYYMQGWEKPEQYNSYTSMLARQIAKGANQAGVDLSPMKIDYTLQQLGGGIARDFLFAWDVAMGNEKPEKQIYDYPVLRRFVKNLERGSKATDAFFKLVGEKTGRLELVENAYRGKINNGERDGAAEYLRNLKEDERAWVVLNTHGFSTMEKRIHPLYNAREQVQIINGMVRQLVNNNLIKEEDVDRTNVVISRRDASAVKLDPKSRAHLMEDLLSLSVAVTRNSMVAVGAKGTTGLKQMDTSEILKRIGAENPEVAKEFNDRIAKKNLPAADQAAAVWPDAKKRLLVDGENADLTDLVPPEVRARAKRRR